MAVRTIHIVAPCVRCGKDGFAYVGRAPWRYDGMCRSCHSLHRRYARMGRKLPPLKIYREPTLTEIAIRAAEVLAERTPASKRPPRPCVSPKDAAREAVREYRRAWRSINGGDAV